MKSLKILFLSLLILSFFTISGQDLNDFQDKIELAKIEKDTLNLTRALYKLGQYYDQQQQIEKSNNALHRALFWAKSIENNKAITSIANYLAANHSFSGKKDSALFYYEIAIQSCIENSDSLKLAAVLINLGDEYASNGNYKEAANHSLRAVKIKESMNDSTELAFFYQKVGEIYKLAGEDNKWEEYVNKAYQLIKNEKYAGVKAQTAIYNDLGGIAENKGNYDQALLYYDTLIMVGRENNFENAIAVALSNSAIIYKLQGNVQKALDAVVSAQEYSSHSVYQNIYDKNLLAELYFANKNPKEAFTYSIAALDDENIDNFPEEKMRAFLLLYKIEKGNENYKKALNWNEKYKELSDSIRDKDVRSRILDMEMAYQSEKNEHLIEILTTENQLKNQRLRAGIVLLTVLIIVILLILYILQIRKRQAKLIQNDLQQQVLRAQMNPHFIFNVLGSIQNFMLQNNNKKAAGFLSQFASLTRATLNNSAAETISLANEISMLNNYIELEQMRTGNLFNFEINYNNDLEVDFIFIPPMLVQPFVENAIKHGFKNLDCPGFLKLQISEKTESIEFIIEDNGNGIIEKDEPQKKYQSMATTIFEKRRKLIQLKYKKDFNFEVQNLKDINPEISGVKITINIPVIDHD